MNRTISFSIQTLTTRQHTSDNAVMEVFASLGLLMSGCIDWNHCSLCSIGVEDQCDNLLGIEVASFILRSGWYVKIQVPRENLCDTNDRLHALLRQKINK